MNTLDLLRSQIKRLEAKPNSENSLALKQCKQQLSALESNPQGGSAQSMFLAGARGKQTSALDKGVLNTAESEKREFRDQESSSEEIVQGTAENGSSRERNEQEGERLGSADEHQAGVVDALTAAVAGHGHKNPGARATKLVNRITKRNRNASSVIRYMPEIGYFRVSVVGLRYFDRGAGGFMGHGEWVFEGRVVCNAYPEVVEDLLRVPAVESKAGWGYQGAVSDASGQKALIEDKASSKGEIEALNHKFWELEEALAYANGDDGGQLAKSSDPVTVSRTKEGYKLKR